ncbi:pyruvate dehydrogenase (acetyl-transferring) E1 component subunit alpha [Acaricomes phytoseiuli]|uniref:pyruvate dehydrogenase (acetyl-transferring) E1 component subunit alpha n=1 Tax=Acaricomes phytoseiuli TaxID=291968 RepID=UPI00037CD660|nr:pyruvate dehydrogenase (acetyl-transferring) E1 component subunit alpha [Acaricomes phytoseiuli]
MSVTAPGPVQSTLAGSTEATSHPDEQIIRLLTPQGERVASPELEPWLGGISAEELLGFYRDMQIIRRIDIEATALQRQGELGLWPPLLGQEAAQVGSMRALRDDDFIFSSYRENGVAHLRGVAFDDLLSVWRGNAHGGWDPYQVNMATTQVIIGAQALHATGYAMGIRNDGADSVAISYFGDGATSQGDVNKAMVFAASFGAPVIFFCQNNHWAISEPVGLQASRPLSERSPGFGIPSLRVDGNDVLAVLAATRLAADRARKGAGPTFIEAVTYRTGPHTTADDPMRYRDARELEAWAEQDPILRLERYLTSAGLLDDTVEADHQRAADDVTQGLRQACLGMVEPAPETLFEHVYSTPHSALARQQEQYRSYLAGFGSEGER